MQLTWMLQGRKIVGYLQREPVTGPADEDAPVLAAVELSDAEAAALGQGKHDAAMEVERMNAFLRAGGAALVRR